EGNGDLGEADDLDRLTLGEVERAVDLEGRGHRAGAEAAGDELAPGDAGLDEVAQRLPVDAAGGEDAIHVLHADAALLGKFLDPGGDVLVGELDSRLAAGLDLDAVLLELLDREFAHIPGGTERLEEAGALLDVVMG